MTVSSGKKTANSIEMPFWLVGQMGPRNYVLAGVQISHGKGQILVEKLDAMGGTMYV